MRLVAWRANDPLRTLIWNQKPIQSMVLRLHGGDSAPETPPWTS